MYKTILYATDLSEDHFDLCQKAVKLASTLGADLHFLHVIEIPSTLQWAQSLGFAELSVPVKDEAQSVLAVLGEALNVPVDHQHVEIGSAHTHILDYIKKLGCDLVILGSEPVSALPTLPGSTGQGVAHHAPCDVLTLRGLAHAK
ncbi:universal stress protein [Legionella sp. CNM-4043-24]|uniref:universal stress protein n=1 Tax=Legionella sp. CNM-4043-24 TaxID=3421646 RepID=UPI00403B0154